MRLQVVLPSRIEVDVPVSKVIARGPEGSFCLLPRHRDLAAALVPGLLTYQHQDPDEERFLGVGGGLLVKQGSLVRVATPFVIQGVPLGEIRQEAQRRARAAREQEAKARTAIERMEADLVRRMMELRHGR